MGRKGDVINSEKANAGTINNRTSDADPLFEIKYFGFTTEAQAAVQKAIDIWSSTIKSDVKIRIFANWAYLDNVSTLAFVTPTEVKNFENAPYKNLWYPIALAEKIARKDINPITEADIVATFNSRRTDWYLGVDGNCPSDKFDLVTVALHEIGHGLGFSGTFRVSNSNGYYGMNDSNPKVYDTYLINGTNQNLLNYPNGSFELATQITGNSVVFKSPIARLLGSTTGNPRVYAPSPYQGGSSISHLDEDTYSDTRNALMTPFAEFGKVTHECGPLVKGMFYEMGWLNTWLFHEELTDQENLAGKKFEAIILSDTTLLPGTAKFKYSFDAFATFEEQVMSSGAEPNSFEGEITNPVSERTVSYYFEVQDVLGRTYRNPISSTDYFSFYYGVDVTKPVITHTVPSSIVQFEPSLTFQATVTDNIGLNSVVFLYQINNGVGQSINMTAEGSIYTVTLNLADLNLQQGDKINYTISATDIASQPNQAVFPATGVSTVAVRTFDTKDVYITDFNSGNEDFFGDFSIATPVGFVNGAIHSNHPYAKSADANGQSFSYTLLYPIRIKSEDSFIEFDEVVLVEPGTGTDHTSPLFGDYVILEGTKDDGENWLSLVSGYDSRKFDTWLTYYNSNISSGDSRAVGTLNYYRHHQVDLLDTFESGDIVNLRFRLFSNNTSTGWGWAIDNLRIQDVVLAVGDSNPEIEKVDVYPNPFKDVVVLKGLNPYWIRIYNLVGQKIIEMAGSDLNQYDLSSLNSGTYLGEIISFDGKSRFIKLLKQ